jgi:hypothetical protein
MTNSEIFLIGFSIFAFVASIIVYNIDFDQWNEKHTH